MADQQASYNACRPWTTLCLYTDSEGRECFEPIDCSTVPDHFRDSHGITNMGREVELTCMWQNCQCRVLRHNFIRHIREHHLRHDRASGHANQPVVRFGG